MNAEGNKQAMPLARWLYFLPAFLFMGAIWWMSSHPVPETVHAWPVLDEMKLTHLIEYSLLALLWLIGFFGSAPRRPEVVYPLTVCLTFLWGISDEIHQIFVPSRTATISDALTDLVAAVICVELHFALTTLARRRRQHRRSSPRP